MDDGSTDGSVDICERYAKKDERIKLFKNSHKGVSVARNTGIQNPSGEWISFVDSDDYAAANMVEELVSKSKGHDYDIIIGGYSVIDGRILKQEKHYPYERLFRFKDNIILITDALLGREGNTTNIGVPWGRIYRRVFVEAGRLRFINGLSRMQDTIFNISVFMIADDVLYIEPFVYNYRIHGESVTSSYRPDFNVTALEIIRLLKELLHSYDNEYVSELLYAKKISLITETIKLKYLPCEDMAFKDKLQDLHVFIKDIGMTERNITGTILTNKQMIIRKLMNPGRVDLIYFLIMLKAKIKELQWF